MNRNGALSLAATVAMALLSTGNALARDNALSFASLTFVYNSTSNTFGTTGSNGWELVPLQYNGVNLTGNYYLNWQATLKSGTVVPGSPYNFGTLSNVTAQVSSTQSSAGDIFSMNSSTAATSAYTPPSGAPSLSVNGGNYGITVDSSLIPLSSPGDSFGVIATDWIPNSSGTGYISTGSGGSFSSPSVPERSSSMAMISLMCCGLLTLHFRAKRS